MTQKQWDVPRPVSHIPIAIVESCLDARTIISPMPTSSVNDLAFYLLPLPSFVSWGHTHSSITVHPQHPHQPSLTTSTTPSFAKPPFQKYQDFDGGTIISGERSIRELESKVKAIKTEHGDAFVYALRSNDKNAKTYKIVIGPLAIDVAVDLNKLTIVVEVYAHILFVGKSQFGGLSGHQSHAESSSKRGKVRRDDSGLNMIPCAGTGRDCKETDSGRLGKHSKKREDVRVHCADLDVIVGKEVVDFGLGILRKTSSPQRSKISGFPKWNVQLYYRRQVRVRVARDEDRLQSFVDTIYVVSV
ncbi:hypothetical protein EDD15DRAFT_2519255 [Pisolithus albus]|nr:hypothetical protein EDD15DRAFT_2519255 [Pisolithus albus]